jgi:hypothetical protein
MSARDPFTTTPISPDGSMLGHERAEDPRAVPDRHLEARLALVRVAGLLRWRDPDSNRGHHDFQD